YRLGKLPGVAGHLNARVLPEGQVIGACRALAEGLVAGTESVDFITHLPRMASPGPAAAAEGKPRPRPPTHVLHQPHAWPIAGGPRLGRDPDAPLRIASDGATARLVNQGYDIIVEGNRDNLRPGDLIRVAGHELRLIEVAPDS